MATGDPQIFCRTCRGIIYVNPISNYYTTYAFENGYYYHPNCLQPIELVFSNDGIILGNKKMIENFEGEIWIKQKKIRDSWEVYFMRQAESASTRSTCDRKHCGAVITKNNRIRGTGYNGSNPGDPHCDDVGHFMVGGNCRRTLHAEINAINDAKEVLSTLQDCKIFINTFPCVQCFAKIIEEGIKEVYYKDEYRTNQIVLDMAKFYNIKIEKVTLDV